MTDLLPLKGKLLLAEAFNHIVLNPETHYQRYWHSDCGTKHCLYGWIEVLNDPTMSIHDHEVEEKVCELIGLPYGGKVSDALAHADATLEYQHQIIADLVHDRIDIHGRKHGTIEFGLFDLDEIT
jgi:hypothetical protein